MMIRYFAYGSNLNLGQMRIRCPHSRFLGWGMVEDYRIAERRYADIEPADGATLYGGVFEIGSPDDLRRLDWYEGYPVLYDRFNIRCRMFGRGRAFPALVYIMTEQGRQQNSGIRFSEGYRAVCSQGAIDCGLPVNYFRKGD